MTAKRPVASRWSAHSDRIRPRSARVEHGQPPLGQRDLISYGTRLSFVEDSAIHPSRRCRECVTTPSHEPDTFATSITSGDPNCSDGRASEPPPPGDESTAVGLTICATSGTCPVDGEPSCGCATAWARCRSPLLGHRRVPRRADECRRFEPPPEVSAIPITIGTTARGSRSPASSRSAGAYPCVPFTALGYLMRCGQAYAARSGARAGRGPPRARRRLRATRAAAGTGRAEPAAGVVDERDGHPTVSSGAAQRHHDELDPPSPSRPPAARASSAMIASNAMSSALTDVASHSDRGSPSSR